MSAPQPQAVRRAYQGDANQQIHYREAGVAGGQRPLLLLHPSPLSSYVFEGFMPEMARDRRVIAPDTPGYGMSDPPHALPEIADFALAMLALLDHLGIPQVDVLGYHTGSLTAAEMARQRPGAIHRIVMISATPFTPEEREQFRAQYAPKTAEERAALLTTGWRFFRDQFWPMEKSDHRAFNLYLQGRHNPDWYSWGHRAAFNYDIVAAVEAIEQPILVLNPEDDLYVYTQRIASHLRNGRVMDLPGWNHGFLDAKSAEVGTILRTFLDS